MAFHADLSTASGRRRAWLDSLFVDHAILRLAWTNFAVVVPGELYRSNHPTPARLARLTRRLGLRTLINLRGRAASGSDALSREAAGALGLDFIDVPFRSSIAPPRARIVELAGVYRDMRRPALIHCKSGADRAGFAAGVFLLLRGGSVADARRHLSLRFGHLRRSEAGALDAVFDAYAREGEGRKPFLAWVEADYDESALAASFHAGALARLVRRE